MMRAADSYSRAVRRCRTTRGRDGPRVPRTVYVAAYAGQRFKWDEVSVCVCGWVREKGTHMG